MMHSKYWMDEFRKMNLCQDNRIIFIDPDQFTFPFRLKR